MNSGSETPDRFRYVSGLAAQRASLNV
ncbi:protein of unknown function [Ectopseudomonas oleovorans]|nr:protein of unknown function [Pseudomonas oleovorans]